MPCSSAQAACPPGLLGPSIKKVETGNEMHKDVDVESG